MQATGPSLMPDFRVLFESLPGSFLVVDRRFGIVAASDAYLEMTRTRLAEIQGKCLCDAFPTPDGSDDFARKELLRESLERVRNLGVPDAMPFQKFWVRESKAEGGGWVERFWSPVSSPVFGPDKRVEFLIHRLDDVTDFVLAGGGRNTASPVTDARVRLERVEADAFQKARQLAEANRKLEKANAEIVRLKLENGELDRQKADFLSRISHEFRSPLTLLAGSLDGLLEPAEDPSRQLSKPQVELAQRGAGRILRMVDSLLDFSLLESGTRTPVYRAEDLSEATLRICDRFRPLALQGGLDLDALCEPLREPVFFDRGMWAEIVSRLLTNALKFTREGSIRVLFRIVGRHAVLRISDTGAGIPEADLPFLFGRFYRGRSPEARTHEGLGMGLAIVREMVRIHGGEIRAESRLGTGSTFTVKVPLGSAHLRKRPTTEGSGAEEEERTVTAALAEAGRWFPAPEAPLPDSSAHRESGPSAIRDGVPRRHRILFADDDVDMRVHVQRVLETRWTVETAADGEEALKRALADPPDLILADALMPALDGMGLARALREDPRTRNLPVLLILARPGERTSLGGLGAAADDCIVKPYAPRDLILWVDGHLRLADIRKRFDAESTAARERILEAQKMEMVGRLAGGVAHDFNNLLTAVNGYADLAMEFTTDDGVRDCLKEIRTAGEKAAETVKLLQAFGRKQFLHAEVLSLNDVIQGLESTLRKLLGGGIRSELRLDPALDLIQADRGQMLQVLMNLSLNAREAMDGEGVLTVETSNAPAGPEGSGDTPCVRLSVKDTGRGIAAEDQERIFEPYYSTKDFGSGKGLGLGLSSVLGIVGRHNGRIRVHSKPGQGAEFEIFLPALSR